MPTEKENGFFSKLLNKCFPEPEPIKVNVGKCIATVRLKTTQQAYEVSVAGKAVRWHPDGKPAPFVGSYGDKVTLLKCFSQKGFFHLTTDKVIPISDISEITFVQEEHWVEV